MTTSRTHKRLALREATPAQLTENWRRLEPCPVTRHAHDCDCRRQPDGSWIIDFACQVPPEVRFA